MEAVKDYDVHIDSKKRVTLRGAKYQLYITYFGNNKTIEMSTIS